MKCHYDPRGNYEKKYLCRWKAGSCSLLADADGFVHESYKGRIQMASSDPENGTYTVVMRHLREEDEGWYWCGAKNGHTEHTSSVKLHIQKGRWWDGLEHNKTLFLNRSFPYSFAGTRGIDSPLYYA